jgi:BirA family transcriptional regulator, biotin operon repressor / biotin---[acetyl-CoA-carboxylase] ligase
LTWIDAIVEPDFPPLLSGRRIVPGASVLVEAVSGAKAGTLGAGDVLWDSDPTRVAVALVLEPDVALRKAAQMLPLAMVAAADCIGALAPPQVGVMFRWPGTVTVNSATVGEIVAISATDAPDHVPEWLVISMELRMRLPPDADEPGKTPEVTTLADEGCEDLSNLDIMGSFARHFLTWLNIWEDDGFRQINQSWIGRAEGNAAPAGHRGLGNLATVSGMDEDGNLLVRDRTTGQVHALGLLDVIETAHKEG